MKMSSAKLLLKGTAEVRSVGEPCDPACFVWYSCRNSVPNGVCKGYDMMNGTKIQKIIRERNIENIKAIDLEYAENCVKTAQRIHNPEIQEQMAVEVYRYLKPPHLTPSTTPNLRFIKIDLEEIRRKNEYPEYCSAQCKHRTCGYYRTENFGKPCKMQFEQYRNKPSYLSDPLGQIDTRSMKESLRP